MTFPEITPEPTREVLAAALTETQDALDGKITRLEQELLRSAQLMVDNAELELRLGATEDVVRVRNAELRVWRLLGESMLFDPGLPAVLRGDVRRLLGRDE